jgi:hypothetical protein
MEFLIYGEDSTNELNIQELEETIEQDQEPEEVISAAELPVEPKELLPLELEIREILGDASPDVLEQYKNMEDAIRRTYDELSALDLPPIDYEQYSRKKKSAVAESLQESNEEKISQWNGAEVLERRRIRFLREHGVELTSEVYKKVRSIQIPNATLNGEYRKMLPTMKQMWKSDPELYSPESQSIPGLVAASPPQKRIWRPQSAITPKKVSFGSPPPVEQVSIKKTKKSTKKRKKKKKEEQYLSFI